MRSVSGDKGFRAISGIDFCGAGIASLCVCTSAKHTDGIQ